MLESGIQCLPFGSQHGLPAGELLSRLLVLLLIGNYIAFHIEPFEEEYERNHPIPSASPTFTTPWENWEAFDKTNVPAAFSYFPAIPLLLFLWLHPGPATVRRAKIPESIVRDKSPPQADTI